MATNTDANTTMPQFNRQEPTQVQGQGHEPRSTSSSSSTGETTLSTLLRSLKITLHEETYVFATVPESDFASSSFPIPLSSIVMFFREPTSSDSGIPASETGGSGAGAKTAITLILPLSQLPSSTPAEWNRKGSSWSYTYESRMLTCAVHSSLEAVGFMAVLATALAESGISANPVSGWFHDHLFVPVHRAEEAVRVLEGVRERAL